MCPIALVTCYFHHNYGSMLQAYATQMIMEELNLPYETLYCRAPISYMKQAKLIYYIKKILVADWRLWYGKMKIRYYRKRYKNTFGCNADLRDSYFDDFAKQYFKTSPYYPTRLELSKASASYSAFLVGSDQLWNTSGAEQGYFTLEFVPDDVLKVAYSTSFGVTKVPWFQIKKNKRFLNRFDFIAVREKSGAKLIGDLTGREVPVVLDPVLLFTGKQWLHLQKLNPMIKDGYIFCYLLGNNPYQRTLIKQMKEKTGLKIVALLHLDEYIRSDETFADEAPYNIGPKEFLNLIRNANYIFTDSFHCSAFSILYKKNFFTFSRFSDSNIQSTNTRIDNLLQSTGLESRRLNKAHTAEYCLSLSSDFDGVEDKLKALRMSSISYLRTAFASFLQ
jgi:hypothetical protein